MPFPFRLLPYGLRQRLITLSTPQEAHDIQTAVGNGISGLQPMQLLKSVDIVKFHNDDGDTICVIKNISSVDTSILKITDIPTNTLYDVDSFYLENITENVLNNAVFDKLYFKNCTYFNVHSINKIGAQFLQKIAGKMTLTHLHLYVVNLEVSLPEVFAIFPNIRQLSCSKLFDGWACDLAKVVQHEIYFSFNETVNFVDFLKVNPDDIAQCLKKDCNIQLRALVPTEISNENACSQIITYMGPKFDSNFSYMHPMPNLGIYMVNNTTNIVDAPYVCFTLHK